MTNDNILYDLQHLSKFYKLKGENFSTDTRQVLAVDNISCKIATGSIFGIVGESGSGKSTLTRMLVGAEKPSKGHIMYEGNADIAQFTKLELTQYQARVKKIFQDPARSLNHRMTVGNILVGSVWYSPIFQNECAVMGMMKKRQRKALAIERVIDMLKAVELDETALERYPTEFSGGQRQRIAIARALVHNPEVLICDEITSALDASTRKHIIDLLLAFKKKTNLTIIFISHDLSMVLYLCDEVMVMHAGKAKEIAPAIELFKNPQSKETLQLLQVLPKFPAKK